MIRGKHYNFLRLRGSGLWAIDLKSKDSTSDILEVMHMQISFRIFFPKAAAKGSFEKSVAIKDCHQSSAEVMAVFKDCNQTLPKVLLE